MASNLHLIGSEVGQLNSEESAIHVKVDVPVAPQTKLMAPLATSDVVYPQHGFV